MSAEVGRRSRNKGKAFERLIAKTFRERWPELDPHRGWQARDGGDAPDVVGVPGLWLECKHRHRPDIRKAYGQAKEESRGRGVPVAVTRRTGEEILCTMGLGDFLALLAAAGYPWDGTGPLAQRQSETCVEQPSESASACPDMPRMCSTSGSGVEPSE